MSDETTRPISNEGRPMNRRKGRMVQASDLLKEIEEIIAKWGNTCFYVTGLSWGSVALWESSDYEAMNSDPATRTRCSCSFSHPPHDFCDGNPDASA